MSDFKLPEKVTKSIGTSPRDLVIISQPKMGKSGIFGDFTIKYQGLILGLEKGGYEYIDSRRIDIHKEESTSDIEAFYNYIEVRNMLMKSKGMYPVLFIDGLSDLDRMSELGGTLLYMDTIVGKNFNRVKTAKGLIKLEPTHPDFKSVLVLPDGGGYYYTRQWFLSQIELFREISPYRVYAAHILDKYIKDKLRDEVVGQEILLTGRLKNIFATKVTALGKLIASDDNKKRYINFDVLNDSIIAGSRAPFLKGKILISEKEDDEIIKTFWENIFDSNFLEKIKC